MLTQVFALAVLILLNGVLAASETALLSVNQNKVRRKAEDGNKKAIHLKAVVEQPNEFLATIQVGISLISLFSGAFATLSFKDHIAEALLRLNPSLSPTLVAAVITFGITIVLSYFSMVFGELAPKRLGMIRSEQFAYMMIRPLSTLAKLTSPIVKLLSLSTSLVMRILGIKPIEHGDDVTEEEIRMMVDAGAEDGTIDEREIEMINNIFEFDDITASDIATHRTEVVSLAVDADYDEIISKAIADKYSRIPVYEENIDNIIGVLHTRDLMKHVIENKNVQELDLRTLLRKAFFVPESKKADAMFREMQKNKVHMAIVVDEYGGTEGIVTMEDLIESVMGDIWDEYDEDERPDIETVDETTFLISGTADLEMVADFLDTDMPTNDYDTLAGFVIGQLGRIPSPDEKPEVECNGFLFKVLQSEENRISQVKVCKV